MNILNHSDDHYDDSDDQCHNLTDVQLHCGLCKEASKYIV